MKIFKEHQLLLMRRESRVVIGHKAINLWLLVIVLTATFFSIAFSEGSQDYLEVKMNDPFTNWVNINKYDNALSKKLGEIKEGLDDDSLMARFLYDDIQTGLSSSLDLFGPNERYNVFRIQYYEKMSSDLIAKVLDKDNMVDGQKTAITPDSISDRSLGIIMTIDAIEHLGYSRNNIPAFVDCRVPLKGADSLQLNTFDGYLKAPVPLLAVVRRLPMNKDILASKYLNQQYDSRTRTEPFNLNKEHYVRKLYFFVPSQVTDFEPGALQCMPDSLRGNTAMVNTTEHSIQERLRTWQTGSVKTVYPEGRPSIYAIKNLEKKILEKYEQQGVRRVYDYDESTDENSEQRHGSSDIDNGLLIHFNDLDSIRSFERYMKDVWNVQLEMSQVNSKENFNAVSTMAKILTMALLLFSILSIIIFIINMMQNYFQKVRRNLGTFKAFGISTRELTRAYIAIIACIIFAALIISLMLTWVVELLLPVFGLMKDGEYSFLLLWNTKTAWAIIIILVATILSILLVMRRLLQQTPGNLIYDR